MLSSNIIMTQPFGFFLREAEYPTRPLRKTFHLIVWHGLSLRHLWPNSHFIDRLGDDQNPKPINLILPIITGQFISCTLMLYLRSIRNGWIDGSRLQF